MGVLREAVKLNGINDVPKWLKAIHQTYDQYVESQVWTARFEKLKSGEPLRPRIPNIMPELVAFFDWTPKQPWNCAKTLSHAELCPAICGFHLTQFRHGTLALAGAATCATEKYDIGLPSSNERIFGVSCEQVS